MKFDRVWTGNWENAFHGLRHPLESYTKSDSDFGIGDCDTWLENCRNEVAYSYCPEGHENENWEKIDEWLAKNGELRFGKYTGEYAYIGKNDLDLAQRMIKAGSPNDKFLRQIFISVDITAPIYYWKELDKYQVATTTNSTSTMHKLASTPITKECFEMGDYQGDLILSNGLSIDENFIFIVNYCEALRQEYLDTKDIEYWKELIRVLPESWLQTRTWSANYAVLRNILHWRKHHRLKYEWDCFIKYCKSLPYSKELLFYNNGYDNYELHDLVK